MCSRIEMEGPVYNTRDLGGYTVKDGRTIRHCRLLRSGALGKCTESDIRQLTEAYGLKTVVDLRTNGEKTELPDPEIKGVEFIHNPLLSDAMLGITREGQEQADSLSAMILELLKEAENHPKENMEKIYLALVSDDFSVTGLKHFFDILLAQKEGAVLWHCSAGKDRVGTATALLLTALGVEREVIIRDYLLTNGYLEPETEAMVAKVAAKVQNERILNGIRILNGAERSYIESMFAETERQCGSTEAYLRERLGFTDEKTDMLREMYLE